MKNILWATLLLMTFNANASLISTGSNTAQWNNFNIRFSGVDDESCRLTIPASCSLTDVGKSTYFTENLIGTQLLSVSQLDTLTSEPNFFDVFTVTDSNKGVWVETPNWQPQIPTAIGYNLFTGNTGNWVAGSSFLTYIEITSDNTVVPITSAMWLFGSGLLGLIGMARRKTN